MDSVRVSTALRKATLVKYTLFVRLKLKMCTAIGTDMASKPQRKDGKRKLM